MNGGRIVLPTHMWKDSSTIFLNDEWKLANVIAKKGSTGKYVLALYSDYLLSKKD